MKWPGSATTKILILSFSPGLALLALGLTGSLLRGASDRYVALFSAEQKTYRRIVLDGIGDRKVQVALDSIGQAEVKVFGVSEDSYVGRRAYEKGYLIPVTFRIDFPGKNVMSIKISGTRFRDIVSFHVVESDIYVIDLYTNTLPRESYFREETISSLWPTGRFQPDIIAGTIQEATAPPAAPLAVEIGRPVPTGRSPYRRVVQRAVAWAGGLSGLLLLAGVPLVWYYQRRREQLTGSVPAGLDMPDDDQPSIGSRSRVWAIMARNGALSYDEATLLTSMESSKAVSRLPGSN